MLAFLASSLQSKRNFNTLQQLKRNLCSSAYESGIIVQRRVLNLKLYLSSQIFSEIFTLMRSKIRIFKIFKLKPSFLYILFCVYLIEITLDRISMSRDYNARTLILYVSDTSVRALLSCARLER